MARIKDYLAEALNTIQAEVTDEEMQAKVIAKVRPLLKKAENEAYELIEDKKLADDSVRDLKSSASDLKNQVAELTDTKKTMQEEIDSMKERLSDPQRDKELDDLRSFKKSVITEKRNSFVNRFSSVMEHPNFGKVKDMFTVPEDKTEDDKLDWSKVEDSVMEKNIAKLDEYEKIGFFEGDKKKPGPDTKKGDLFAPPHKVDKPTTANEAERRIEEYEQQNK